MRRQAGVRLLLLKVFLYLLFGCGTGTGGGDSYTSYVYDSNLPGHRGGIEISSDRMRARIFVSTRCYTTVYGPFYGEWVDLNHSGTSFAEFVYYCNATGYHIREKFVLEVMEGRFRIGFCMGSAIRRFPDCTLRYGEWASFCPPGGYSQVGSYRVETSGSRDDPLLRVCVNDTQLGWVCGSWVSYRCCPSGYTYNPGSGVCEADPSYSCPSGSAYNPSSGKCEADPLVTHTCPVDPGLPCIDSGNGFYCSPNPCYDASQVSVSNNDTQQGINDIPEDGTVDTSGCLGTVYIFNGRDMRCRPPGTQTGFSDCCKKTTTWFGMAQCNETEKQLASLRSWGQLDGNCHYVGSYCAEEWLDVCVQRKKTFCCFSSPLARIIHEQGRPQLGIGWGTPTSPNCRGFTAQEFQKLDFSKMDFSEWIEEEVSSRIAPQIGTSISEVINQVQSQLQQQ